MRASPLHVFGSKFKFRDLSRAATAAELREENEELRERILLLEEALIGEGSLPPVLNLTSTHEALLLMLSKREFVTKEQAWLGLYGAQAGDAPDVKIINSFIHYLRKKVAPHGMTITTVWGRGFSLDEASRERVKQMTSVAGAA